MSRRFRHIRAACIVGVATALCATSSIANTVITGVTVTGVIIVSSATGSQAAVVYIAPATGGGNLGPYETCSETAANPFELWIDFSSTVQPTGLTLYASVLTALAAGSTMNFGVGGCADSGVLPKVYEVAVCANTLSVCPGM
jgi:hypothetical protein